MSNQEQNNSLNTSLIELLQSQKEAVDNGNLDVDLSTELTALLTSAVHDKSPRYSVSEILHAIITCGVASFLDSLNIIPLLLSYDVPEAGGILSLISECGSAKESMIAVQESLERLTLDISDDPSKENNLFLQFERLLQICNGVVTRLKLRKRSASKTLRTLFSDIAQATEQLAAYLNSQESVSIANHMCSLLRSSISWATFQDDEQDRSKFKSMCKELLLSALGDLSRKLETNLAQNKFELCFPRLFPKRTNLIHESLVREYADVASSIDVTLESLLKEKTTGALVLFSYMLSQSKSSTPSPIEMYTSLYPLIASSLQSLVALDASLYIMLNIFFSPSSPSTWDPDILSPVATSLASLACVSPDPQIRFMSFRILGKLLSCMPPLEHMSLLRDLLLEESFPVMRVAAIGLLKDAVLEALTSNSKSSGANPFASPNLFRTFGYIVLRSVPPDLFSKMDSKESLDLFLKSQEPKRLVECLAFYYVILMRDTHNLTGIRDISQIKSVEKEFLSPIREALNNWSNSQDTPANVSSMSIAALQASIERVDEAVKKISTSAEH